MLQHSLSIQIHGKCLPLFSDQNQLIMCLGKEDNYSCSGRHCLLFSSSICMISLQDGKDEASGNDKHVEKIMRIMF
jgi:hypothetical protein